MQSLHNSESQLDPEDEMETLRRLLFAEESAAILQLKDRLASISDPTHLGSSLPEAISLHHDSPDKKLATSLQNPLIEALQLSVQKDKKPLSAALFPILGPAIRFYVKDTFTGMFDELNETLRTATSFNRIKWWLEAKLTGKDVSEYIILKTFQYSVEDLLLISPDSGILLQHLSDKDDDQQDADMVSGMLIAIRSFVKDSFSTTNEHGEELCRFSFGQKEILLENGPDAIIAAVTLGIPPAEYREAMSDALEQLHTEAGEELRNFSGDQEALKQQCAQHLSPLLRKERGEHSPIKQAPKWPGFLILGLLGIATLTLATISVRNKIWTYKLKQQISAEPGIELVSIQPRLFGNGEIKILRDPAATSIETIYSQASVHLDWQSTSEIPYLSLDPIFQTKREEENLKTQLKSQQTITNLTKIIGDQKVELAKTQKNFTELQKTLFEETAKTTNTREAILKTPSRSEIAPLLKALFYEKYPISKTTSLQHIQSNRWKLVGSAPKKIYEQIISSPTLIEGHVFDLTSFQEDQNIVYLAIVKKIEAQTIHYRNATTTRLSIGNQAADDIIKNINNLVIYCDKTNTQLPTLTLHASRIKGSLATFNQQVVINRLNDLQKEIAAIHPHLQIKTVINNHNDQTRWGVYVKLSQQH